MKIEQYDTIEQWLKARESGIGASESATVLGINPWQSPIELWGRKTGQLPPLDETAAMHSGHLFEDAVAKEYAARNRVEFIPLHNAIIRHKSAPVFGSPDRLIKDLDCGLEIKTTGENALDLVDGDGELIWGDEGTDLVPPYYLIQCQHLMAVTGFSLWDLAVYFGFKTYRQYRIQADIELQEKIVSACTLFFNTNVKNKIPPLPSAIEKDKGAMSEYLKIRYPISKGNYLPVDEKLAMIITELAMRRSETKSAESAELELENKVKAVIGETDGLEWQKDGKPQRITWTSAKGRDRVSWESLARSFNPTQEQIKKFSTVSAGARRFCVPRSWSEANKNGERISVTANINAGELS